MIAFRKIQVADGVRGHALVQGRSVAARSPSRPRSALAPTNYDRPAPLRGCLLEHRRSQQALIRSPVLGFLHIAQRPGH